jgi:hypothetical protein
MIGNSEAVIGPACVHHKDRQLSTPSDSKKNEEVSNTEQPPATNQRRRNIYCSSRDAREILAKVRRCSLPLAVIFAVGVDSTLLETRRPLWESAGNCVTSAESIREAIVQFRDSVFDVLLLGDSIPIEDRERLTFLIRASGSQIPVVCMTESSSRHHGFADATVRHQGDNLLQVIEELLSARDKEGCGNTGREVDERPPFHMLQGLRTLRMLWPRETTTRLSGGIL